VSGSLRPRIVVLQGERILTARELPADHEWHLGRRPDSPVPLQERSISRHHARLYCDAAGTHLEDLGTPNGTWVDGAQLRGSVLLRDGQLVRLGQSTNPDPILLRYEDPASRLLAAIERAPSRTSPAEGTSEPPAAAAPAGALAAQPAALGGDPADQAALAGSGAPPTGSPAPEPERAAGAPLFGLGARAIVGACVAFALVFWLLWALRSTQKPWQSVRVEPLRVQPGERISIRGPEVEPSDTLKVSIGTQQAALEQASLGQLVVVVPEQPSLEAGIQTVELRIERRGIVVLKQGLQFQTLPTIARVEPAAAAVADSVALVGGGFVADPTLVQVRIGGKDATVLRAEPHRLEVRVPIVTRADTVDVPVEVEIEGLRSREARLQVRPREAPCARLAWTARPAAPRVFEVAHDFGPMLLVEGPRSVAAADEPPAATRRALEALREAFAAPPSSTVRFEVDERGRSPVLAVKGLSGSARTVATLSTPVRDFLRERMPELRVPELILYWQATLLNELHAVFVRGQPPRGLPESEPIGALLRRLHQLSLDTGGSGCPAAAELATLTEGERRSLETAALNVPPRFGDVAGAWEGSFQSAASDQPSQAGSEMRLELEQTGTRLAGRIFLIEVRGPGIRWSPPPLVGLEGRVRPEEGVQVELRLPPVAPHEITQLTGTVVDDVMSGTYRTSRGRSGAFQLAYKPR
jgi:hypothetical protein